MKKKYTPIVRIQLLSLLLVTLIFTLPLDLFGQNGSGNRNKQITIAVSCIEYDENGQLKVHFGYDNPSNKTVVIDENGSVVIYNHGQAIKAGLYVFEPGVKEKAFSQDFEYLDEVEWSVTLDNGDVITVTADISYNKCSDEGLPIIPGYLPPEGGKEYLSKIGAELTSLHNVYAFDPVNFSGATDAIFQINGSKVLIEVVANSGMYTDMLNSLDNLGFDLVTSDPILNRATGWVEIGELLELNFFTALEYARPVYPGVSNYSLSKTGRIQTQGDFAMHSDFARFGYEIDGSGVKIGVLSNSYNSQGIADDDVRNGDLPGLDNFHENFTPVQVLKDILSTPGGLSDEGRAMLQIIHDIAPGAELAFRTGYLGELDMARGIRELADSGTHIIVDDLSYITEPFFRDGIISQTIDSVVNEGHTFFSSAGNFGRASYEADFISADAPATINGTAHDFSGSGDIFQSVLLPEGDYTLVLQWDDNSDPSMNTTTTDLDLFLSDDAGFSLLGFNRENVGGFPIEVVPFSIIGDTVQANVVIARASGAVPVHFKYILFRGGSQFQMLEYGAGGSSTIVGHPNAAGAISVGAVRFDKNPTYNEEYQVPVIMSFSSVGGTPVNGVVRAKPDITAPNGVNTTVDLGGGDWETHLPPYTVDIDPDRIYPNFFGTSAASPHAAGVAALIMDAKLKYDSVSHVSPDTIRAILKSTAIDGDDPGEDHVSGSGFIQAHKAIMTFANPSPFLENLLLAAGGGVPGVEITPFSFIIKGDFFTDSTQVLFRGEPLDTGVVVVDESTIIVNHEGFIGNPEVQVYNPVISESGLDGGESNVWKFSNKVRQRVFITANDLTKKFGEALHDSMYSVEIQIVTTDDEVLTLEEAVSGGIMLQIEADRLEGLAYSVPAGDTSDAGQYIILPSLYPEVDTVNPAEVDLSLSERFIVEFVSGNLIIEKLALTITPMDTSLVYGQMLPANGFNFSYQIGDSSIVVSNPDSILQVIQQEHSAALTNEVALVRGVALVNGIPVIRGTALVNGVTMLRGVALVNGVEVKVEVTGSDTTVYVAGEPLVNGGTLIRGVALVNDRPFVNMTQIVRGTALVNGDEVTFDDGYMTALNNVPLENKIAAVRGVALVNGPGLRGVALVNGVEIVVDENGVTTIDQQTVPTSGIVEINGIPVIRGTALVNSSLISRGVALVNDLGVEITNGVPTGRGIALVNGSTLRGIALVNGLPLIKGTALVNSLEVNVVDGEVSTVFENGTPVVNGLTMNRGIALVNGTALVNGGQLISRGTALVNGIALTDEEGDGEDLVNLANMNFMASSAALANGLNSVRGTALVNGLESEDGEALKIAAGTVQQDGSIVFENGFTSRGVALVNGLNYVRGTALVNGSPLNLRGTALVNGSTVNDSTNNGTILVFDATELGDTTENVGFTPISFITGTTVGQHWIVPGTYISNNYEISYGLGTLTIEPADLTITAADKAKTYGEADPELTFTETGLFPDDTIIGELIREEGEDVGDYAILQGSLSAGHNYTVHYDSAKLAIGLRTMVIGIAADDRTYDGTDTVATTALIVSGLVAGDSVIVSSANGTFETKDVGVDKAVTANVSKSGPDAGNYLANESAGTTATVSERELVIGIAAVDKAYDGSPAAVTSAHVVSGLVLNDAVTVSSSNGLFDTKHVDTDKPVVADVLASGDDAHNYTANTEAATTASISAIDLAIGITATDKAYDGNTTAATGAHVVSGLVLNDAVTVSSSNGLFDTKHVGTNKPVTASVSASGDDAGNYNVNALAETTASISAIDLVIGITATDKAYDGNPTAATGAHVASGLVLNDAVTVSSSNGRFDNKHVGTNKPVTADVSASGDDAGNYNVNALAETTASISAINLVIGITATDKAYDGNPTAATGAHVASGLVLNDAVTVSSSNGRFDDKHVGTNKPVTADVSASGTDAGNYNVNTLAETTASISAINLVIGITATDKAYDGNPTAATGAHVASGLVPNDAVTVSSSNGLFDTKHVGTNKPVTASVSASGTDAGNYNFNTLAETTASISAINLVIGITAGNKTYDGTNTASTSAHVVSGLVGGDNVGAQSSGGYFSTANAGTGLIVTANVYATGGDAANYTVNSPATATADIFQKEVYVSPLEEEFSIAMKDPLPLPAFNYDGWIAGDEEVFGYTALGESDGIAYDIESKKSYGHYILTPVPSHPNYSFIIETGLLYVRKHDDVGHSDDDHDHHSKSAAVSGAAVDELEADYLNAYPNPVVDKFHVTMKDIQNYKLVQLYDISGKSHPITSIDKRTDNLEIDMAELPSGHYIMRIIMEDSARVVQVIKN